MNHISESHSAMKAAIIPLKYLQRIVFRGNVQQSRPCDVLRQQCCFEECSNTCNLNAGQIKSHRLIPDSNILEPQAANGVSWSKAFVSQSDNQDNALHGIEEAAHREKWWTLLKETVTMIFNEDERRIVGIQNAKNEMKAILEEGIDNLCV
jgi:hypothetical protein